jgi:hypothetical protein
MNWINFVKNQKPLNTVTIINTNETTANNSVILVYKLQSTVMPKLRETANNTKRYI